MRTIFLLDANAFLTPSKNYYNFDLAPSYWEKLNQLATDGRIKTIDKINDEICVRDKENKKDDLQIWFENEFKGEVVQTKDQKIVNEYQKVIQYLYNTPKYSKKAFLEWGSNHELADPWLIATAKVKNWSIVTLEIKKHYNGGTPLKNAKIPNVCEDLHVDCVDVFSMMRELGIKM